MYDHTFYKQVQISRSDIRPHIKWAVSLVILHMVTSIFLRALCGYTHFITKKKQTIIQRFVNSLPFCGYVIAHVADTHNSSGPVGQPMEPEENIQR